MKPLSDTEVWISGMYIQDFNSLSLIPPQTLEEADYKCHLVSDNEIILIPS